MSRSRQLGASGHFEACQEMFRAGADGDVRQLVFLVNFCVNVAVSRSSSVVLMQHIDAVADRRYCFLV